MKKWACVVVMLGGVWAVQAQQAPSPIFGLTVLSAQAGSNCGMQLNQTPAIFCETFDQPSPVTNRAGQLNGLVWGVSRLRGEGSMWSLSTLQGCNGPVAASPVGATDVVICNGQLRESLDDDHDVAVLAMYPKQPFDFAGRTGTVAFDVTNDTAGTHGSWPEFWITDQPVPAPFLNTGCAFCSLPRNGFGIAFDADRGSCGNGWRAYEMTVVRNYVPENRSIFENNTTGTRIQETGCAGLSAGPNGGLNHIEIRVSQNQIDVYASDPGQTALRQINTITNANLTFTKGLIWIQDGHYNADKAVEFNGVPSQKNHTYTWDNVAFDGPATYRDLSFDVLDAGTTNSNGTIELGWAAVPASPAHVMTLPMTTANINAATGALLVFNFGLWNTPTAFSYTVNGHPNTAPSPLPSMFHGNQSIAVPVPLSQLQSGSQDLLISSDVDMRVSNINLVLVAAASVPGGSDPPPPPPPPVCAQPVFTQMIGQIYHLGTCTDGSAQHTLIIP